MGQEAPQSRRKRDRIKSLLVAQAYQCHYCSREWPRVALAKLQKLGLAQPTLEHKIPLVRGGSDESGNLVLACQTCNNAKGALTEEEFLLVRSQSLALPAARRRARLQ